MDKLGVLEPTLALVACHLHRLSDTINYMERERHSLEELFPPRGVAVVGASQSGKDSFATRVVQSLKEAGFPGCIVCRTNPSHCALLLMATLKSFINTTSHR